MQLLFVCTGNTCRSAMAEAAAKKLIAEHPEQYGDITVQSAGVMCAGPSPASSYAILAAKQNGCDLSTHTAKQISESMLDEADYIFAMTRGHKQMLERIAPQYRDKLFLLNAYAEGSPDAADVPDPYGGSPEEYLQCFAVLETSVAQILDKLK
ncbi:MAG: low molecular weight protein arginine phosphatase [Peptococcaceae bacterium]|nr:low molecular weight protein arginine phosphatase [Peptococcaceae bacterium]